MNHARIVEACSERPYANRSYMLHQLDDRWFDVLNWNGHVCGLNGYCLDALDDIPQGCMVAGLERGRHGAGLPGMPHTYRGWTWAEMQSMQAEMDEMIAEILAEQA